ncbi:hypothetical protein [Thauera phenolivorans]|uniref:hypothetical protein n=1 Tax=Thauera phenolivorans TaxID=1792543 RepID=UPI0018E2E94F|nr:hypothetical protein [Thauera phenolivorans]
MTERSGGNGAVAVFMACYDCFFVQSIPPASKRQARYAVGRCVMLWSSNDVTQQGSRPKTKLAIIFTPFRIRRMKYARTFLLAFLLAAIAGYLSHAALGTSLPNLIQVGIEKYTQSKTAAKSFPISIYLLLMASALTQLLISFKVSPRLMQIATEKALGRVLKVGGAFIGVIAGMTAAFYQAGNSTEVQAGVGLILMVATFMIAPILIAMSLRLLSEDDPNPGRAKVLRWTIRICCAGIMLIAAYGIVDEANKNIGAPKQQTSTLGNQGDRTDIAYPYDVNGLRSCT